MLFYLRKTKPHFSRMLPVQLPFLTQTEVLLMARRKKETLLSEAGGQVTETHSPFQPGGRRWWFFGGGHVNMQSLYYLKPPRCPEGRPEDKH